MKDLLDCDQLEDFAATTTSKQKRALETERFRLTVPDLDFVLEFAGYRFQKLSLRNALWRGLSLGTYKNESYESWSSSRDSEGRQREVARAMGMTRGRLFREIIDRLSARSTPLGSNASDE